jgi:hypothetical protein
MKLVTANFAMSAESKRSDFHALTQFHFSFGFEMLILGDSLQIVYELFCIKQFSDFFEFHANSKKPYCSTGVNPSVIGGFSGLCAFMGVAATFLSATLVKQLGILKVTSSACYTCYKSPSICCSALALIVFCLQPGWSSWTCISGFSSLLSCCCVLEWVSLSAEPCTLLLGIDCKHFHLFVCLFSILTSELLSHVYF